MTTNMTHTSSTEVIIVNWNTRDLLAQCLSSIFDNAPHNDVRVTVVDNKSADGSCEMLEQRFPQVTLIRNPDNAGFGAANNVALKRLSTTYALLLNSDTVVPKGAIDLLIDFAEAYPRAGVVGCQLLNADQSDQASWARFPTPLTELLSIYPRTRYTIIDPRFQAYDVDWVSGACMLVRASAIKQIGLFDERFFMYSEETDLCYRIKKAGWRICHVADSRIVHFGAGSMSRASARQLKFLYSSKIQYFAKHQGAGVARAYRYALVGRVLMSMATRVPVAFIAKERKAIKARWNLAQALVHEV